jgi:putative DNA primase/helicase
MMKFTAIAHLLKGIVPQRQSISLRRGDAKQTPLKLQPIGLNDFLTLNVPPREMLLDPILPERSLAMLYAPRGVGKTLLGLSIGLAVASGSPLLRWSAPKPRRVLYVDGEMPMVSLQERLRLLSAGLTKIPEDGLRILAADNTENGISLGTENGQKAIEPLLSDIDLLILDNLSTLCTGSESASDAWLPMQNWLLGLRRRGIAVLLIHHAGTNGRQRGTSRREDALDTVIALRRPEDYSPEQGARFEVHFEKIRNRVDGDGAVAFEARLETVLTDAAEVVRWSAHSLRPPIFKHAAELYEQGLTVRQVAATLGISKTEAGRLRLKVSNGGLLAGGDEPADRTTNGHGSVSGSGFASRSHLASEGSVEVNRVR